MSDEPTTEQGAAEVEIDPAVLAQTVQEYGAALTALLGEDYEDVLDKRLVRMRDGTVVFIGAEQPAEGEGGDDAGGEDEAEAETEPVGAAAAEPKRGKPAAAAAVTAVTKLPSAFAARQPAAEPELTMETVAGMAPSDFMKNRDKIYELVAEPA